MGKSIPHRLYVTAAMAFAAGGFAMTAAILSGDPSELHRLIDAFLYGFRVMVIGLAIRPRTTEG
ncbi:hypothetical protein EDE08_103123 [Bradyrhizobium sp. R2.2-H]|jgi:hypothetical protein|uniref:hypothetical protein n=1 Tax=unclassified Bradyrhizobium TaxID=2631580 RepID=UPI001043334A|nr:MULTISPECIES: hypothetical protein [unclassified Bradyrhizobium]TCU74908.1 hypothetical protein EDE10_103122 [Bradyrhizobium sp. Y-H1]TCU77676.1 hypothetical protein EDE08_103123 [Bradyrhizobium sp. R2.2-H]